MEGSTQQYDIGRTWHFVLLGHGLDVDEAHIAHFAVFSLDVLHVGIVGDVDKRNT